MSSIISTSNGSVVWVFYDYLALYLIISVFLPRLFCFYIYIFSAFLKIPKRVFLMPVQVTHFTHSLSIEWNFFSLKIEKKIGRFRQILCVLISSYQ